MVGWTMFFWLPFPAEMQVAFLQTSLGPKTVVGNSRSRFVQEQQMEVYSFEIEHGT